jgi:hypothetical protein
VIPVAQLFLSVSVIFVAAAVRDDLRSDGKLTPKLATWLRIAIIFAAVPAALSILNSLMK